MLILYSELDAINYILTTVGESPVNQIDTNNIDVVNIKRLLDSNTRQILLAGYPFNVVENFKLYPDEHTHQISIPANVIKFDTGTPTQIKRNGKLYDMQQQSDRFKAPVICKAYLNVPFEDLPDTFKTYAVLKTAVSFQQRFFGDTDQTQELMLLLTEAYNDVVYYEVKAANANLFQNSSVVGIINR